VPFCGLLGIAPTRVACSQKAVSVIKVEDTSSVQAYDVSWKGKIEPTHEDFD